jgi:hypothetical protein
VTRSPTFLTSSCPRSRAKLIEAEEREADLAVLAVHVFATAKTRRELVAANKKTFARFASLLAGVPEGQISDGQLVGPFTVPGGGGIPSMAGLIGSVTTSSEPAHPEPT